MTTLDEHLLAKTSILFLNCETKENPVYQSDSETLLASGLIKGSAGLAGLTHPSPNPKSKVHHG